MDLVNQTGKVEANDLRQKLVDLSGGFLRPHGGPKLPLERRERRLDVGAAMVVASEVVTVSVEVMPETPPRLSGFGAVRTSVALERDVRDRVEALDQLEV